MVKGSKNEKARISSPLPSVDLTIRVLLQGASGIWFEVLRACHIRK